MHKSVFDLVSDCLKKLLKTEQLPFSDAELWKVITHIKIQYLKAGQTLFTQGDSGTSAYIVVNGLLQGQVEYQEVNQNKKFDIQAGEIFGEISLIVGMPRTATIYVEKDVTLLELSRNAFAHLLLLPHVAEILAELVLQRQNDDLHYLGQLKNIDQEDIPYHPKQENILQYFWKILADHKLLSEP